MSRLISCISLIAVAIVYWGASSFAQLPEAEIERLNSIVEVKLNDPDPYGPKWSIECEHACEEALRGKAYSVLETALRTGDPGLLVRILPLVEKVPIQERKVILISALENSRVWPADPERYRFDPGSVPFVVGIGQQMFCRLVSEAFGVRGKYPEFWSKEDRAELAAKIRATGDPAIPPKPPDATATPSATQPAPNIPGAPTPTAPEQKPEAPIPNPLGPVWWTAIGIAAVLLAAWFGKRK